MRITIPSEKAVVAADAFDQRADYFEQAAQDVRENVPEGRLISGSVEAWEDHARWLREQAKVIRRSV